jgi:hypothetical protein
MGDETPLFQVAQCRANSPRLQPSLLSKGIERGQTQLSDQGEDEALHHAQIPVDYFGFFHDNNVATLSD